MKSKRTICLLLTALLMLGALPFVHASAETTDYGIKEFIWVRIPGEDTEKSVQLRDDMAKAMTEAIGIPVTVYRATDYTAAVEAMRTGHAHMAGLGPFSYVSARERANAEPLVVTATDGKHGYYSLILVRSDSNIQSLEELKGKTFAFVDPESTSGNIIPTDLFIKSFPELNLTFDDLHTDGVFFRSAMYAGTHPSAIQAVIKGNVDAAAVTNGTLANQIEKGNVAEDELRVLVQSELIPASPIAIRKDLPQELKDKVLEFLLSYDNEEYFGGPGKRYMKAVDSDYDYLAELKETYGLSD